MIFPNHCQYLAISHRGSAHVPSTSKASPLFNSCTPVTNIQPSICQQTKTARMHVVPCAKGPMQLLQGVMAELRADPVLCKTLDSPRVQRAIKELKDNPTKAMVKYAEDAEVMAVVRRLVAVGVTEGAGYGQDFFSGLGCEGTDRVARDQEGAGGAVFSASSSPAELASQLFSDPKLAAKLAQPKIRKALSEIRANPEAGMKKWEADSEVSELLNMLEAAVGGNTVIDV